MMKNHARRLSAGFSALLSLSLVACAGQAPVTPIATVSACAHPWDGGKRAQDGGLTMEEVTGREMAAFVENYNAHKPPTDFAPDHLYLFSHEDVPAVLMVMVQGNCIIQTDTIPAPMIPALKGGVAS